MVGVRRYPKVGWGYGEILPFRGENSESRERRRELVSRIGIDGGICLEEFLRYLAGTAAGRERIRRILDEELSDG